MIHGQTIGETFRRYRTLTTDRITTLPVVILMPHSACNCQCVMCDIWKGNKQLNQLREKDILGLLSTLKKYHTKEVVMSGGEAILNPNFFLFCELLRGEDIHVTLLSTGLTMGNHAANLVRWVNEIIISLDGDEGTHDRIRRIPGAFGKLKAGMHSIRQIKPDFRITGRSVIHRQNFRKWSSIIEAAKELGLHKISFLPADVSSEAFNRPVPWSESRQQEILLSKPELEELKLIIQAVIEQHRPDFASGFIAESPLKIQYIYAYYAAFYGLNPFPYKKCNAPWVSTVIEADGTVRPCFFHRPIGNIRTESLDKILNGDNAYQFRAHLDMKTNYTCRHCVCSLYLSPFRNPTPGN